MHASRGAAAERLCRLRRELRHQGNQPRLLQVRPGVGGAGRRGAGRGGAGLRRVGRRRVGKVKTGWGGVGLGEYGHGES